MNKKIKKLASILLTFILFSCIPSNIYAQDMNSIAEQYELIQIETDEYIESSDSEITPYGRYYSTITTRISEVSTGKVYLQVTVNCTQTVASIQSTLILQKLVSGTWTDVASTTVSATNTSQMTKTVSASGLGSGGTYRAKSSTKITGSTGLSETATGYSGAIILS